MLSFLSGKLLISPFALVLVLIISLSPDAPFLFIALASALFHEAGHLLAMKMLKVRVTSLSVYPFGADIKAQTDSVSYLSEIMCVLSGPLVSLVLGTAFGIAVYAFPNVYFFAACTVNLLIFILNILPVRGFDGGRALFAILLSRLDYTVACSIFSVVSAIAFGIVCFGAFALIYYTGYNLSLIFICIYMFISEYVKSKAL